LAPEESVKSLELLGFVGNKRNFIPDENKQFDGSVAEKGRKVGEIATRAGRIAAAANKQSLAYVLAHKFQGIFSQPSFRLPCAT
jgi:phage gp16-like protein